jgi:hypothetical protein
MLMCSFAVEVTQIDFEKKIVYFKIIDKNSFELNKKYFTVDSNRISFYFVKQNKDLHIRLKGVTERHIYKKSFFAFDTHYSFLTTETEFEFCSPNQFTESKISLGDILFIRSNLVYRCCG